MSLKLLPYNQSLSLLTDLYQLTMAYGYFKNEKHEEEAVFHLFYRKNPFKGSFAIAAGLAPVIDFINNVKITLDDIEYIRTLKGNDEQPLFDEQFLTYLKNMDFSCDVDAIAEGEIVFAHEPLVRIQGPIIQCQILETALLNIINFQTLVATKAARICHAADGEAVMEFGLRRAQGIDGSLSASRAAFIGGCSSTSNVLAGKMFNIPVKGTHAHSWVMSFDDEEEAFSAYANVMPNNCVFLVDTYNTLKGVEKAIRIGNSLREKGHEMTGIRLDSGNLAKLSIKARKMLDDAGFTGAKIIASNDLDEHAIKKIKSLGGKVNVWGIGTKLVTCHDQPALGGVYKISGIRKSSLHPWNYKIKLSEDPIKVSQPGILQVRRFFKNGMIHQDVISNSDQMPSDTSTAYTLETSRPQKIKNLKFRDLLIPIFRKGQLIYQIPELKQTRSYSMEQQSLLPQKYWKYENSEAFPVALEEKLFLLKRSLLKKSSEAPLKESKEMIPEATLPLLHAKSFLKFCLKTFFLIRKAP